MLTLPSVHRHRLNTAMYAKDKSTSGNQSPAAGPVGATNCEPEPVAAIGIQVFIIGGR